MNAAQMKQRLLEAFPNAVDVQVFDTTGTEDHWDVFVHAESLKDLSRIDRQRKVMDAFAPELATGEVHALSIRTQA